MARRSGDPRQRAVAVDPLGLFASGDMCWCRSGSRYRDCHEIRGLSEPGAPLPPDPDDAFYIAPAVSVARDAFGSDGPVALTNHFPVPQLVYPVDVGIDVRPVELRDGRVPQPHRETGLMRFAVLETNGIFDADQVTSGELDGVLERCAQDVLDAAAELSGLALERLLYDRVQVDTRRPVVMHHAIGDVSKVVGQTLFWADHYTTPDPLARLRSARGPLQLQSVRDAVVELLRLRPLVEAGVVVPVDDEVARATSADAIEFAAQADLSNHEYFSWVEQQIVLEGPTAREAAFVHVVDDDAGDDWFYLRASMMKRPSQGSPDDPAVGGRLLGRYDPAADYEPWLRTVRRQAAVQLAQQVCREVAVADSFGSSLLTRTPFRARALRHRHGGPVSADDRPSLRGAVFATVPWLPDADPALLLRIASDTDRVDNLRELTEQALRGVADDDVAGQAGAIADLSKDLGSAGAKLGRELRRSRVVEAGVGGGVAIGGALIGATLGPAEAVAGALAGLGAGLPVYESGRRKRKSAAYAFWIAKPRTK